MRGLVLGLGLVFILLIGFYYSQQYRSDNHPVLNEVRRRFRILHPSYGEIPLKKGKSAYTEHKQVITLCLEDPEASECSLIRGCGTGQVCGTHGKCVYDINTIMYVALHELAHVISISRDHTDEFKQNFGKLLKLAAAKGVYDPTRKIPITYCGIDS